MPPRVKKTLLPKEFSKATKGLPLQPHPEATKNVDQEHRSKATHPLLDGQAQVAQSPTKVTDLVDYSEQIELLDCIGKKKSEAITVDDNSDKNDNKSKSSR
eukprot:3418185-Ditylum_brightwellii.AAC.1